MDDEPKYNFAPWWTLLTILFSHQDKWKVDKCSYVSTKNCITLLGDMFAERGIMRNSSLFQIPRQITMWCLPFCYLLQHLLTKLTLLWHCKLTTDAEKNYTLQLKIESTRNLIFCFNIKSEFKKSEKEEK